MANPDATTLPGPDFIDTLPPAPHVTPAPASRPHSDAPDRMLFYFSGFDPKGATFYHRLFRNGIGQRNASHDETLAVGGRHRVGRWASVWTTLWRGAPAPGGGRPPTMRTRVHFMRWDDLVRRHWRRTPGQLARDYWNVYVRGAICGVLWRVRRQAPSAFGLAMLPLGVALVSLMAGLLVGSALEWIGALSPLASALVGLVMGAVLWRGLARWVDCEWLLRLYAFVRSQALGDTPEVDERLEEMAGHVIEAVEARLRQPGAGPLREIMFVGHSTGTLLASQVLARALGQLGEMVDSRRNRSGMTLSLVTLGHCLPIATEWPGAQRLRGELDVLSECPSLTWHDYSASSDRAAFWRAPPWPVPARLRGHQASPRFRGRLSAAAYAQLRRDERDAHLQYLRPPVAKGDADTFDFFALTCGPATLAERHSSLKSPADLRG
ncbi:MAG: hypothetical protein ACTHL8_16175 [Burkholderiaceae bacterium]